MRDKEALKRYTKERVVKGKSIRRAAKAAGVPVATAARAEPLVKNAMAKALASVGCTEKKIATTVFEALDATKVISATVVRGKPDSLADEKDSMADANSMTKDFIDVPDFQARIKAAELAGKFRGDFIERVEHSGGVDIINHSERIMSARKAKESLLRSRSAKVKG